MSVPFHKQTDPTKQAGQIVNPVPEHLTLSGYIKTTRRAQALDDVANEKRLTFNEWFAKYNEKHGLPPAYIIAKDAWEAALTQGKL